ncbi:hypothetical protein MRX96_058324 [Rhipicephalus microplus]
MSAQKLHPIDAARLSAPYSRSRQISRGRPSRNAVQAQTTREKRARVAQCPLWASPIASDAVPSRCVPSSREASVKKKSESASSVHRAVEHLHKGERPWWRDRGPPLIAVATGRLSNLAHVPAPGPQTRGAPVAAPWPRMPPALSNAAMPLSRSRPVSLRPRLLPSVSRESSGRERARANGPRVGAASGASVHGIACSDDTHFGRKRCTPFLVRFEYNLPRYFRCLLEGLFPPT